MTFLVIALSSLLASALIVLADVHPASAQTLLTSGVASSSVVTGAGEADFYRVSAQSGETLSLFLDGAEDSSRNTLDLYVKYGGPPTTESYDYAGILPKGADQALLVEETRAGEYYILVQCSHYWSPYGKPEYSYTITAHTTDTMSTLELGTPSTGTVARGGDARWYQVLPGAGKELFIDLQAIENASRNTFDLYIKHGDLPSIDSYDSRGVLTASPDQALLVRDTAAGYYYVLVYCSSYLSPYGRPEYGYTVAARTEGTMPGLATGSPTDDKVSRGGDARWYQVAMAAGETLSIELDATEDATRNTFDLYVRYGDLPSTDTYDLRGILADSPDQALVLTDTQAGYYYVLVYCSYYWSPYAFPEYGYTIAANGRPAGTDPSPPGREDESLTGSVPLPSEVSTDPKVVSTNLLLTAAFVLAFYFAATLFNGTVKENYQTVQEWVRGITRRLGSVERYVSERTRRLPRLSLRVGICLTAGTVVTISAMMYCLIDPAFAFNLKGLALFLALLASVGIMTLAYDGIQAALMARHFRIPAGFRVYWIALLVALICVGTSNAIDFHPGVIFGFVGAATVLSAQKPNERQEAIVILASAVLVMAIAVGAFYSRGLISTAARQEGNFGILVADNALSGTCVAGLEGLVFMLLPITFLDGGKLAAWKWWVDLAALSLAVFFFIWFIINKDGTIVDAARNVRMAVMIGLAASSVILSSAVWLYFRSRHRRPGRRGVPVPTPSQSEENLDQLVETMTSRVRARDPNVARHQQKVTGLALAIAAELGLSHRRSRAVQVAAALHDVGKTLLPTELLNKRDKLTRAELEAVKSHPRSGSQMLTDEHCPQTIVDIVAQHHERMDGSGYPLGLKGEKSSLEARIVAVADVVAAMTSEQPHKRASSLDEALKEIARHKGKLYDAGVVDACLAVFEKGSFKFAQQGLLGS